jgi:O-acetylhomoserine/O-acetylserine sulfhydrylase-like pyridoxal-dependent enzyme
VKRLNQDLRTDEVTDVTIGRIDARLDALETRVTALESSVPWARGTATLSGGTVTVTFADLVPADAVVLASHKLITGTPGFITYAVSSDKITFTSSDGGDESDFDYAIFRPA